MENDYNARDFSKGSKFVRKEDLRASGPRCLTIKTVEVIDAFPDKDKPPAKELALVFTDGTRLALSTQTNLDTMIDLFGERSSGWMGKTIELYCDPTVRNPSGARVGGIRIARPDTQDADEHSFTSDLEDTPPVKGNGAEKQPARSSRARA